MQHVTVWSQLSPFCQPGERTGFIFKSMLVAEQASAWQRLRQAISDDDGEARP